MPSSHDQPRVSFLLGKPLRSGVVLADVRNLLSAASILVDTHVPNGGQPLPDWLLASDLVVQRGLGLAALTSAAELERGGVRCCNRIAATIRLRDRAVMTASLAAAGVPVPATFVTATWPDVRDAFSGVQVVVKRADGVDGRGIGVLIAATGELPPVPPFAGPYIVQDYIPSDGVDYKVYMVGTGASGLVKRWSPDGPTTPAAPFTVGEAFREVACLAGAALGLEIYGVDILAGPDGPVVVDVNPFPGFRGVADAAVRIAHHLESILAGDA